MSVFMLFSAGGASAQQQGGFTGPSLIVTVAQVRSFPDKAGAILTGNIVNALPGGKHYTFRDHTGEIIVEIEWKVWQGLSIGASEDVEISGEVKVSRGQVSIKVKGIRKATV